MTLAWRTIPAWKELDHYAEITPDYMRPNNLPNIVIAEGYLTDAECDEIVETFRTVEGFDFHGCGALTRECERPLDSCLEPIVTHTKQTNALYWRYDIDDEAAAWMQTYDEGGEYQMHMDSAPGQMRKLSAVAFLTNHKSYSGGVLRMFITPNVYTIPATKGTIVIFQPWLPHAVSEVTSGTRQTINLGFWGPPFR